LALVQFVVAPVLQLGSIGVERQGFTSAQSSTASWMILWPAVVAADDVAVLEEVVEQRPGLDVQPGAKRRPGLRKVLPSPGLRGFLYRAQRPRRYCTDWRGLARRWWWSATHAAGKAKEVIANAFEITLLGVHGGEHPPAR
jgi:hypothetical protein